MKYMIFILAVVLVVMSGPAEARRLMRVAPQEEEQFDIVPQEEQSQDTEATPQQGNNLPWLGADAEEEEQEIVNEMAQESADTVKPLAIIVFNKDVVEVADIHKEMLDRLVLRLLTDTDIRVMVESYASPREGKLNAARRISLKRATSVRSYLMQKGVAKERINVRALGDMQDQEPLDRVDVVPLL